ncbi:UvrD-helicase domain-containing protein [Actinomadura barringtoniae]|uniref:UvrD-helicase domain-containing protein n=1 Tax=Actinomadura barringtoniae TaxID=1427535 RepID=A0A939T3I6_9ACTN|nr:UvrD-helicase domain-containing protein [Actinomadura barringtoniae]MBO2451221.1 UvrD-helicase domain-containing protein [Actinomadura barringtoniae]
MVAGGSASAHARQAREYAMQLWRRYRDAYELAGRYEVAAEAERKVAATLLTLTGDGKWRLLVDRRWPGTRSANVDMILVGPGGVFVIDVKRWRHAPVVAGDHLLAGDDQREGERRDGERRDGEVEKLLAMTQEAERQVATLGMSPVALRPLMVFAGHRVDTTLGRVRLLGDQEVIQMLVAEPRRLTPAMVRAVSAHLETAFPAYETPVLGKGNGDAAADASPLFEVEEVEEAALRSALAAPIEQWMTFLHPDQVAMARRTWNGPARISGPVGTGKTVVGLHRAAYLAERTPGKLLYVTFVNNLPRVQGQLFSRLAPVSTDRVEFTSLHGWAQRFLAERGVKVCLSSERAETAFSLAWMRAGLDSALVDIESSPFYWREEIDHVIKGRGLTSLEEYRTVPRHGRRTALQTEHREAAWLLYEEYELLLSERGVQDFNDVLLGALAELQAEPMEPPYGAVIVDEVQDLTLIGVKLLHALVGDARNGLLLIGDGQQAVYPGGFRLSDAGIDIKGRGVTLRTNYRNAAQILDAALELISADPYDDLDGTTSSGRRDLELTYHDGTLVRADETSDAAHDRRLVEALKAVPAGDAAVLCATRREIAHYHRLLTGAGVPVLRLENYDGREVEAVKLGSYRRAKGLEFKCVFLPHHDVALREVSVESAAERERAEILRRQLFVAMTRARDLLWLGSVRVNEGLVG